MAFPGFEVVETPPPAECCASAAGVPEGLCVPRWEAGAGVDPVDGVGVAAGFLREPNSQPKNEDLGFGVAAGSSGLAKVAGEGGSPRFVGDVVDGFSPLAASADLFSPVAVEAAAIRSVGATSWA